ncbi:MAG TPA: hypothetical protein VFM23_01805 [Gemmatimonadales bacterium]|nr:hypothetical protein [Gemmatimonadales bacterium]
MFVDALKGALRRLAPSVFERLRLQTKRRRTLRRILEDRDPVVRDGPFAGMRFVYLGTSSGELPMVVGCFEAELHEHLEALLALDPRVVVNIGCAEGYYAVGLARRLPRATIVAIDTDPAALRLCAAVASLNGVSDRVRLEAHADLGARDLRGALIVCDCEGCEYTLLDPARVPGLAHSNLIIELHHTADPAQPEKLLAPFRATHDVAIVPFTPTCAARERILAALALEEDRALVRAERTMPDQAWAVLKSRAL